MWQLKKYRIIILNHPESFWRWSFPTSSSLALKRKRVSGTAHHSYLLAAADDSYQNSASGCSLENAYLMIKAAHVVDIKISCYCCWSHEALIHVREICHEHADILPDLWRCAGFWNHCTPWPIRPANWLLFDPINTRKKRRRRYGTTISDILTCYHESTESPDKNRCQTLWVFHFYCPIPIMYLVCLDAGQHPAFRWMGWHMIFPI